MIVLDLQQADYDDSYTNGTSNGTVDPVFRKIQKYATAFHIWRVENMNIVALPRDQYGTFYDTDAYLIYSAGHYGQPAGIDTIPKEVRGVQLEYHVHFWLGSSTPADKSGVAAYKSVELDNFIGGISVQHREAQGNESSRFRSYFKGGFKILSGALQHQLGIVSKLYQVNGKRSAIITEYPSVDWKFFNSRNVFLIRTPRVIFVWVGRAANSTEKLHSAKAALEIKETYNTSGSVVFVDDGYEQTLSDDEKREFDKYLPLDKRATCLRATDDEDEELQKHNSLIRLYKCADNNGKYRVAEVKISPLEQTDLVSQNVFILDQGLLGIWVWVGKKVHEKEKAEALRNARGFVKKKRYPNNVKVTRVVEGSEPLEFKALFLAWHDDNGNKANSAYKTAKIALTKFDGDFMNDRILLAAETQIIDDGSGRVHIWRVKRLELVEVATERYGTLFSGDCYVILYKYEVNSKQKHIIYYWLGLQSSSQDADFAVSKAIELDKEYGEKTTLVRVFQENEPAHFLQLFKGKLTIFKGKASDYESDRNLKNSTYLLRISGSTSYSTKGVHVPCKASALNSNFCYVLKRGKRSYIWCGSYSTGDQREMAKGFAGKDVELILEGKERDQFWDILGGKTLYTTTKLPEIVEEGRIPRFLYCSRRDDGIIEVEEVLSFTMTDLMPEETVLLDAYKTVFIWTGNYCHKAEHKYLVDMVEEYLITDPAGRNTHTPIFTVRQGNEPCNFKGYFSSWDEKDSVKHQPFDMVRRKLESKGVPFKSTNGSHIQQTHDQFDRYEKYPLHILKGPNDKLPPKINPLNKELHLTHDDFVMQFKMKYKEFESLPRWKQQELKKKVGLF